MDEKLAREVRDGVSRPPVDDHLRRPLLLYEDGCPFCSRAARLVAEIDKSERLSMLPFCDPEAARWVVFLTEDEVKESWRLIVPDGRRLTRGEAGIALLEYVDATRWLGRALRVLRLAWLVGAIDWVISELRPLLSRLVKKRPPFRRPPV